MPKGENAAMHPPSCISETMDDRSAGVFRLALQENPELDKEAIHPDLCRTHVNVQQAYVHWFIGKKSETAGKAIQFIV
jgi:hypothetical protein